MVGSPANIPIPEQELPAEVALFDDVVVGESDKARLAGSNAHACKVLHKLAAQSSSTNQKELHILQAPLYTLAKNSDLRIVA